MEYQDKLGCYRVGDLKFYSKLEAIEMHTKTGIHPHWDFNEAIFDSYNWTVEPKENILELYRQRAQQLRDQYDYIVLMYSGGADSQTVLESFIDNDIKLDEVASFTNYEATGDRDNFLNAEIFRVTIPKFDQLKDQYPWMKHRVIDLSSLMVNHFEKKSTMFDWIYSMNHCFNPNASSREGLPLKIKEWADMIYEGKKVCMLWGLDKPRVLHVDGKFLVRFLDFIDAGPTVKSIAGEQPYTDELFYWSPDMPTIIIKQAQLIKTYLSQPNFKNLPFVSTTKSDLAFREVDGIKYWLSNHGMHKIIYPNWNIETFSSGKPGSIIATPRDTWFFGLEKSSTSRYHWQAGLEKLFAMIPDYWKNSPSDYTQGLRGCWSKYYCLED
jgi:hypothetical protein